MYSGIIKHIGEIENLDRQKGLTSFSIKTPIGFLEDVTIGASISVDGVCLTVTEFDKGVFKADAMEETLRISNLAALQLGEKVHLERSLKANAEIGGHLLSGHIDGTASVTNIYKTENNYVISFSLLKDLKRYVFNKGYIGINGCSLTVSNYDRDNGTFQVWLIPETLRQTTFSKLQAGMVANIEIERSTQVIVDTIYYTIKDIMNV